MTTTRPCGYGTQTGCSTCIQDGNDGEPFLISTMEEPPAGSVVRLDNGTRDDGPFPFPQRFYVRSAHQETDRWFDPLDWTVTDWWTLLHEASPLSPVVVQDPLIEALSVELAQLKRWVGTEECPGCDTPMSYGLTRFNGDPVSNPVIS